jgi:hypothetical protein
MSAAAALAAEACPFKKYSMPAEICQTGLMGQHDDPQI